jgi:opacity protein-like surface antigen
MRATQFMLAGALVAGIGLAGHGARAADAVAIAATPPPPWHGVYVGGGGGYAWGTLHTQARTEILLGPTTDFHAHLNADGGFWTAIIGADIQRGAHVFGVFADYTWLDDFDHSETVDLGAGTFKTSSGNIDSLVTVAGRIGWVWSPVSMFYGLAGWSWARGSLREFEDCGIACELAYSGSFDPDGWTLGAGLERLYHDNRWSLRMEYRYTHLNHESVSGNCTASCAPDRVGRLSADGYIHSIRAAATLRFPILPRIF